MGVSDDALFLWEDPLVAVQYGVCQIGREHLPYDVGVEVAVSRFRYKVPVHA